MTGADIRAARARMDETQIQFGHRFGVSRWTVALWEEEGPPSNGPARLLIERVLSELNPEIQIPGENHEIRSMDD